MEKNNTAILLDNVTKSIQSIIEDRKLKYIEDTPEFIEGLLVGLEIAGIYGEDIRKMYSGSKLNSSSE